ncbi:MAG: polysaccharide pyruvyl transferase family protein [Methylococcaceae bacterium]|jgi:pyruvyltransferase
MKKIIKKIYYKTKFAFNDMNPMLKESIRIEWACRPKNFGDILNPVLVSKLIGKNILNIRAEYYEKEHYLVIGSILQYANKQSIVWGSGFISSDSQCHEKPLKVCAVRGPLSRQKLIESGIECPEVYGDPALLLPMVYNPKIEKKYKIGIIPHYIDKDNKWIKEIQNTNEDILVIDLINKNPLEVANLILSCERVGSSSLHGLIVADAYQIPSLWLEFSDSLIIGGHFKFLDYFASIGKNIKKPLLIKTNTKIEEIIENTQYIELSIDLNKLIEACPFKILNNSPL